MKQVMVVLFAGLLLVSGWSKANGMNAFVAAYEAKILQEAYGDACGTRHDDIEDIENCMIDQLASILLLDTVVENKLLDIDSVAVCMNIHTFKYHQLPDMAYIIENNCVVWNDVIQDLND